MTIIGITGGSGAGKTSALRALSALGALVIDCDAVYHELLLSSTEMLTELDGSFDGVVVDGRLDRTKLGEIVFSDPKALKKLSEIARRYVGDEVKERLAEWEKADGKAAAIDAIGLVEGNLKELCAFLVAITAPEETRLDRIIARDGITREQAKRRISAQRSDSYFVENCDYTIENAYATAAEFEEKCREFFAEKLGGEISDGR